MRPPLPARDRRKRRGHSVYMVALVLPISIGFVSLAVDTAMLAVARAQLQTVADAAALAGAQQLADDRRLTGTSNISSEMASANSQASSIGQANSVLSQASSIKQDSSNTGTGDVLIGYLDPSNPSSTLDTSIVSEPKYNSVQVTARRSTDRVGVVPTFFAQLFGFNGTTVSVQSTATAWPWTVKGVQGDGSNSAHLLPIVLDQNTYNAMIAGQTQDLYSWDPTTQTVSNGPDGVTESLLYPVKNGSPGNWGTINVGVSNNSTSTVANQIQYGITPSQLATFSNSTIALDPANTPPSITFNGNPGISAGMKGSLDAVIGEPVILPIYDNSGANGNNAWYRVIAFAPVRIMATNFQGNPKYLIVQPALSRELLGIPGTPVSSWSQGGLVQLYLSR